MSAGMYRFSRFALYKQANRASLSLRGRQDVLFRQRQHAFAVHAMQIQPSQDGSDVSEIVCSIPPERIRNFCIISHVDHGKSTLADRLMELTGLIGTSGSQGQLLDSLDIERARGITIKAQTVSLFYYPQPESLPYLINLIDTPGHVDFSYEVSRSIAACQGALLLVDATKGVQAQTVANFFLAFEQDLSIIPVVNKVDLGHADVAGTLEQMSSAFDVDPSDTLAISAKTGLGVDALLPALLERTPPLSACEDSPLRVLLFDAWHDEHRGVLCLMQVLGGKLQPGTRLVSAANKKEYAVLSVSLMRIAQIPIDRLGPGQVGCVCLGMKAISEASIGDTFSHPSSPQPAVPGFKRPQAMVFAGLYPTLESGFDELQTAMDRFLLKDASVVVENEHSPTLGRGLRCGFLGLLHMEVVQQRLLEEHGVDVLMTSPTVPLQATLKDGSVRNVNSPEMLPDSKELESLTEPIVAATIITPAEYLGGLISLCENACGEQVEQTFLGPERVVLRYKLPLAEIATDFHDRMKTLSSGYASLDYEPSGSQPADVVALGLRVNGEPVAALTRIVRRSNSIALGKAMVATLKGEMQRQVYDIVIQATVGSTVIARETVKAMRKNVLAKCYGGDVSRKRKLLDKQKEGKKRANLTVGSVEIPHEAYVKVLTKKS